MAGYTPLIFDVTQDPDVMGVSGGLQVARSNPDCSTRSPVWKPPKVEGTHVALKTSRKSAIVVPAANPDIVPRLLNVKQAAAYTGATVWAIRQLYWAKEIAGFVAGRRLLLDRTSLDRWIDRRLQERAAV